MISDPYRSSDIRTLLGLRTWAARVLMATYFAAVFLIAIKTMDGVSSAAATFGALAVIAAGSILVVSVEGDPMPRTAAAGAALSAPLASAIILAATTWPPTFTWYYWPAIAATPVQTFLAARGRTALAWVSWGTSMMVFVAWNLTNGREPSTDVGAHLTSVGPLLMATYFAFRIRPIAQTIFVLRERTVRQAAAESAARAALVERKALAQQLDILTRPLLERIASKQPLDAEELTQCDLLEAQLRDSLRAPKLATAPVSTAARAARQRGVEVVLLDDGGLDGIPDDLSARVLAAISLRLDQCSAGTVTARILPPGRSRLATVLAVDGARSDRLEIDPGGVPADSGDHRAADEPTEPPRFLR